MSGEFQANDAVQVAGRDNNSNNQFTTHTHNYAPTQPTAPPPPLRRCPLPSTRFTGRKAELEKMARYFFREELKRRNFAIIGMGGCGKSQLAFQFFHEEVLENDRFHPSMVFFIDATTLATLEESWKAIAESKGIGNTSKAALDWLSNSRTPSFVLVDNADDPNISLHEYLPRSTRVSILFTTRLHDAGHQYGSGEDSCIELQALEEADAEELVMKTARLPDSERPLVKTLLKELHCYALAVVQAGAGIRTLHLSVDQYIQLFRQHRTALMDGKKDGVTPDSLDAYRWTVQSAYRISVSHLHDKPSARSLLGLLGHLHHSGITEEMFRRAFIKIKTYKPAVSLSSEEESALSLLREMLATFAAPDGSWDTLAFKRAMGELSSLVSYDKTNGYQIHPLICDALRDDHPDGFLAAFLLTLARLFDMGDGVFSYRLLPHADRILSSLDERRLDPDLASSLGKICVHLDQGRISERLLRSAVERCQREAGADTPSTLRCLASLSYVLHMAGRYSEALDIDDKVLKKRTVLFGLDHQATLDAMDTLAATLHALGRYDKAESMKRQVTEKRTVLFGPDHPATVDAMQNLAHTLRFLGRYDEAKSMEEQAMEKQTMLLGPDHLETVNAMANLAATLDSLRRYDEAESMKKQVMEKRTMLFGPDHPDTIIAMGNLAATLHSLGRYHEAESMQKQVMEKRTMILGPDHPDTVIAMGNLASALHSLGRYDEAELIEKQVLEKRTVLLGLDHPVTIIAKANLANTLHSLGHYHEAESMRKQVMEKRTMLLGPNHPETAEAMGNLAATLHSLGHYDDAESMEQQVLEKRTMLLGPDHPETVLAMANLANTLHSLGRYDEAESMEKQVLEKRTLLLGPDHPDVGRAMANLSYTIRALGRKQEAHGMLEKALALLSKSFGEFHPDTVYYRSDLALWRDELEEGKPPIPAIKESLRTAHCTIVPSSSSSIDNTFTPQPTSSPEAHSTSLASVTRPPSPTPPPKFPNTKSKGFLRHVGTLLKPRRQRK